MKKVIISREVKRSLANITPDEIKATSRFFHITDMAILTYPIKYEVAAYLN